MFRIKMFRVNGDKRGQNSAMVKGPRDRGPHDGGSHMEGLGCL